MIDEKLYQKGNRLMRATKLIRILTRLFFNGAAYGFLAMLLAIIPIFIADTLVPMMIVGGICFGCLILAFVFLIIGIPIYISYKSFMVKHLYQDSIRQAFPDSTYEPAKHVDTEFVSCKSSYRKNHDLLVGVWETATGTDRIRGKWCGLDFTFSDLHLAYSIYNGANNTSTPITVFRGQVFEIRNLRLPPLPGEYKFLTRLPDKVTEDRIGTRLTYPGTAANGDRFGDKLKVYTKDFPDAQAFYNVFTPEIQEKLLQIAALAAGDISMKYAHGTLWIMDNSNRDFFDEIPTNNKENGETPFDAVVSQTDKQLLYIKNILAGVSVLEGVSTGVSDTISF